MASKEMVALRAPVQFWRTLASYAQWLLERAEAGHGYCPRIGAQEAAEAYLKVARKIRAKRETTLRLDRKIWTWLARGLYEAERDRQEIPPELRPPFERAGLAGRFLARLLHEQGCWPADHGFTRVDLSTWGEWSRYDDWTK